MDVSLTAVDDASHIYAETKGMFEIVYPQFTPRGVCMMESLASANWHQFQAPQWAHKTALSTFACELTMLGGPDL